MDKIEEIARAMSAAVNAGKPPIVQWDKLHREERWLYETAARAAYEVMASQIEQLKAVNHAWQLQSEASDGEVVWLWRNFVDGKPEYWAFDNPFPCESEHGDPLTLGNPCGWAIVKHSVNGRPSVSADEVRAALTQSSVQPD